MISKDCFCWVLAIVYMTSQGSKSERLAPVMHTEDTVPGVFKGQGIGLPELLDAVILPVTKEQSETVSGSSLW